MLDEDIRQRAYTLWEQQGRPEGTADDFWHQAREQLQAEQADADGDAETFSGGIESEVAPPAPRHE